MSLLASIVVPSLSTTSLQELILTWGYGVVFMAMLLESAGLPLPGETITLIGGYADGSGQLKVLGVIAAAASGAIIGDSLGYWIGRRAGWPLLLRLRQQAPRGLPFACLSAASGAVWCSASTPRRNWSYCLNGCRRAARKWASIPTARYLQPAADAAGCTIKP